MLYLHIAPTQETFRHKVTVSVEKRNITLGSLARIYKSQKTPKDYCPHKQKQSIRQTKAKNMKTKRSYLPTSAPVLIHVQCCLRLSNPHLSHPILYYGTLGIRWDKSQVCHMCSSHCIETWDRTEFIPPVPLCHGTLGIGWDWSQVYHVLA